MSEENKQEKNKKEGFFKKILKSIKDFDKYEDFALERPVEAFKYLIKLIALLCAIVCVAYTYKIVDNVNKLYIGVKDKIPEFSYENGELIADTEEPTIIEDYGDMIGTIIIDTQNDTSKIKENYSESIEKYGSAIIFTKNNVNIYNSQVTGNLSYNYSDILSQYNVQSFNKQDLINNIENTNIISVSFSIYFVMFIYLFILYFISIMMDVLILSLLAYIISRVSRIKLKYAPSFNIAVHSITLPVMLNLIYIIVNLLTGFEIKYFQIMYNTISYIYVVVAILMIKTDFINRQAELIKIAQEQMKIKEELKKQEEQKEKNKEDNNDKPVEKDNKKEEKDKKEEKKKKENGPGEPVGDSLIKSE